MIKLNDFEEVRVTVEEFRGVHYLSIRKYYLDFDGETWHPTKDGVNVPASIENVDTILNDLLKLVSEAEGKELIKKYL